jgi:electron transport complex protein RnfC
MPTSACPIEEAPLPKEVIVPLMQHFGRRARPTVKQGDTVLAGQLIGEADGSFSANIHSPISGEVTALCRHPSPIGMSVLSVIIKADGDQRVQRMSTIQNPTKEQTIMRVKDAGIVGQGGAMFPSHIKLSPPSDCTIDTLVINGAECEPYLCADQRLMVEKTEELIRGIDLIKTALGIERAFIAIEKNKQDAIRALRLKATNAKVVALPTSYPQGAEKILIKKITGREVPPGKIPCNVGAVVFNVGTAFAIARAVDQGMPLVERIVTVCGAVEHPANLRVRIGTPFSDLLEHFGARTYEKVICGGPMMGISQGSLDVPVIKGTTGVLVLDNAESPPETTCIRCGRCLRNCPVNLAPTTLAHYIKNNRIDESKENGLLNCFECGACSYGCPSKIPLVHYFKYGKALIARRAQGKKAAA